MVGQLAYSLMPWRISASASTLTVWNSLTPQALSTWQASAEKPHCGNCGVPFMKSTTGCPITCALMRCWGSCCCVVSMGSILPPSPGDAGYAGQIGPAGVRFKPRRLEQLPHRLLLPLAMLEEQPAAGQQVRRRLADDDPNRVEPIAAGEEREPRLERQGREMRVAHGDIRGIADDAFEALAGERLEPAAQAPLDVQAKFGGVLPRQRERLCARIGADHARRWKMPLERERDRARAGAQVEHRAGPARQRNVDEELGLRTRDEHRGVDRELEAVELLAAEDVRDRLAAGAARDEREVLLLRFTRDFFFGKGYERGLRKSAGRGKQQARLARIDTAGAQGLRDRQAASSASAVSCSVWCSAESAATSSSSSPSMMRSIL